MVYKKYGNTFRRIREQKHLSLSAFSGIGISKASLSKFERGESMMNFENVVRALQEMGTTLEEFDHFLNDYSLGEKELILDEIERATINQDTDELIHLATRSQHQGYHFLALAATSSYRLLTETEIDEVVNHLYEIDVWSYKDLRIFYFTMDNLATRDILYILDLFLSAGHTLFNSERHRGYFVQACCRAITLLSYRGYKEYAEHIINRMDTYHLVSTMFHRNLVNVTNGFWVYRFEDKERGNQMMLQAIEIFRAVSTPEIAKYYQARYDFFVKEKEK